MAPNLKIRTTVLTNSQKIPIKPYSLPFPARKHHIIDPDITISRLVHTLAFLYKGKYCAHLHVLRKK